MRTLLLIFCLFFGIATYAQTSINGTVKDTNGDPVPGANIVVVGTTV